MTAENDALEKVLGLLRERQNGPELSVEERRAMADRNADVWGRPDGVAIEAVEIAGLKAEWNRASGEDAAPLLLYLHGGGYWFGSPASHRHVTARLAQTSGAHVLSLDYPLAPEHPFPAAVDGALAAYEALLAGGTEPRRIAIAGDSAGGGLTVATMLAARDKGLPLPATGVCISPWSDLTCETETYRTRAAVDPMITQQGISGTAERYLAGTDPKTPLASPNFADLAGLPPLLIQVGDHEVLLDDARILADRARDAGVDVDYQVWPNMFHVWHAFWPMLPQGDRAIEVIGDYLRKYWA